MQGKRWCFTLNNYTYADLEAFHNAIDRTYVIIGKEVGASGTPHLQGYITFFKNKRLGAVRAIHRRAHWEITRGSTDENIKYCSQDGDFHELGERPKVTYSHVLLTLRKGGRVDERGRGEINCFLNL